MKSFSNKSLNGVIDSLYEIFFKDYNSVLETLRTYAVSIGSSDAIRFKVLEILKEKLKSCVFYLEEVGYLIDVNDLYKKLYEVLDRFDWQSLFINENPNHKFLNLFYKSKLKHIFALCVNDKKALLTASFFSVPLFLWFSLSPQALSLSFFAKLFILFVPFLSIWIYKFTTLMYYQNKKGLQLNETALFKILTNLYFELFFDITKRLLRQKGLSLSSFSNDEFIAEMMLFLRELLYIDDPLLLRKHIKSYIKHIQKNYGIEVLDLEKDAVFNEEIEKYFKPRGIIPYGVSIVMLEPAVVKSEAGCKRLIRAGVVIKK